MRPDVLILTPDAPAYRALLEDLAQEGVDVRAASSAPAARDAWRGQVVLLGQPDLVAEVLPDMPGVGWVQSTWAGVTPLLRLGRRDYVLTGVKGVFGPEMAEYVFAALLARATRMDERRAHQARREWWDQPSEGLKGKTLGIMGTGSIGRHLAGVARFFGMRVLGFSRRGAPVEGFERVYPAGRLAGFLAQPDYLVCLLPDTPETDGLLDAGAFRALQNHCLLVNVGRGSLVDEAALADALRRGELAGAVLDVFREEPLPPDSPLWDAPGAVLTAHVAAKSRPREIVGIFLENYRRFVAGEPLKYVVDFERGY